MRKKGYAVCALCRHKEEKTPPNSIRENEIIPKTYPIYKTTPKYEDALYYNRTIFYIEYEVGILWDTYTLVYKMKKTEDKKTGRAKNTIIETPTIPEKK